MNGAHDLGGMHGFGPIAAEPEKEEPVFHAAWEKRVFGLVLTTGALGKWNIDKSRFARERQRPADYLRHSYYENWLAGLQTLLVEKGLVTPEEMASGIAAGLADADVRGRLLKAQDIAETLALGSPAAVPAMAPPRFQAGDRVKCKNRHPTGHTREPRYVRGRVGVIHEHHGTHIFPDDSAAGGPNPAATRGRHLYSVRFAAQELWGENADGNSAVYVDLWEDYLEPA
jgi:nitrile hydratase subunit beta